MSYNPTVTNFKRDMRNLTNTLAKNMEHAFSLQADELISNMQQRVPVEEESRFAHHLYDSIRKKNVSTETKPSFLVLAGGHLTTHRTPGGPYDYALAIEFGTHHNPPEPFFYVTAREYKASSISSTKETLATTIEENNRVRALRTQNYTVGVFSKTTVSVGHRGAVVLQK